MSSSRATPIDLLQNLFPAEMITGITDVLNRASSRTASGVHRTQHIAYTLIKSSGHIMVYLDMPGFTKDSIDVDFYNNQLSITGYRPSPALSEDEKTIHSNIKYGQFSEAITLPVSVTDKKNVNVTYKDGTLFINIDLVKEEKNRFKINIGSQETKFPVEELILG